MTLTAKEGWAYFGAYDEGSWEENYLQRVRGTGHPVPGDELVATGRVWIRTGPKRLVDDEWVDMPKIGLIQPDERYVVHTVLEVDPDFFWVEVSPAGVEDKPDVKAVQPVARPTSTTKENGIWWEHPVAEATGGYDANEDRTLINSFNLVVYGPSSVEIAIRGIVQDCVTTSATAAYGAFKTAPSPEVGARLAFAWTTFHSALKGCLTIRNVGNELWNKFEIGYIRRGRWEKGLRLRFSAENPAAESYRQLHNLVKDKLPDPLNKLISFYISSQEFPSVDIKLEPPQLVRDIVAQLPEPRELRKIIDVAEEYAMKGGKRIIAEAKEEAQRAVRRLGQDAIREGEKIVQEVIQIVGQQAEAAVRQAPNIIEDFLPRVEDGRVTLPHPVRFLIPPIPGIEFPRIRF
jgi:vacuolar-type H+-ATPase subunit H